MNSHPGPGSHESSFAQPPGDSRPAAIRALWRDRRRSCGSVLRDLKRSHAVAVFLGTTTAVSAAFWVVGQAFDARILVSGLPVSALMFVAPLIGAVAACPSSEWSAALRRLRARSWRETAVALGAALSWAPLIPAAVFATSLVGAVRGREIGRLEVDWKLGAIALAIFLITATAEELGWTWFLTRRLSALAVGQAALLIGAIWAALHVIPWAQAGRDWAWIVGQSAFSVVFRLVLVAGYRLTARLGVVIGMHATYNVAWVLVEDSEAGYAPGLTALVLLPIAVFVWLRARRARHATPPVVPR